ncbi:MAG TPA: hypothetical protein VFM65_04195 [Flavobacteriaceae bacterium]|nr:hypothetical protein [Flavobacteriaceae bacterium]
MGVFCFSGTVFGQLDENRAEVPDGLTIPLDIPDENADKTPYSPKTNIGLTDEKQQNGFESIISDPDSYFRKKTDFDMTTDNGFAERTIEFEPDYLKKDHRDSGGKGNQNTQYLGRFTTKGKFVEIYYRDHEYVDGDRIQVMINGKVVAESVELFGSFQPVLVTLDKGFNRIEFKALNEGTSSPNTAEFVVYDEMGNVITQNRWNLATGVKASILINKP